MVELNTELYINEKLYKYKNYFIPEEEGEYKIKVKFDTNLTDCSYMFAGCENIIKLNFISFNTFFVKNMKYMFYKCINLQEINILSFDTANVTDMSYMFYECENLLNLDLSFLNNKEIKNYMSYCFKNFSLLDISNFNIKEVVNFEGIFNNCNKLNDLNLYVANIITSNLSKRNKELMLFILYNVINKEKSLKINTNKIPNDFPFYPFILKYDDSEINTNFILI